MAPSDRADAGDEADPVGGEDEDEDGPEEPERLLDQVRADDALEQPVETLDEPFQEVLRALGTSVMRRVASCAKTIRPTATIQVTTIELVIGKPNGRAISTAFCDRPCSAGAWAAASATVDQPRTATAMAVESRRRALRVLATIFVRS